MTFLASMPRGVCALTAARNISPVAIWGMSKCLVIKLAWVPLPAPGGPKSISRIQFLLDFRNSQYKLSNYAALRKFMHRLKQVLFVFTQGIGVVPVLNPLRYQRPEQALMQGAAPQFDNHFLVPAIVLTSQIALRRLGLAEKIVAKILCGRHIGRCGGRP